MSCHVAAYLPAYPPNQPSPALAPTSHLTTLPTSRQVTPTLPVRTAADPDITATMHMHTGLG
jgi:hypothetical protein